MCFKLSRVICEIIPNKRVYFQFGKGDAGVGDISAEESLKLGIVKYLEQVEVLNTR